MGWSSRLRRQAADHPLLVHVRLLLSRRMSRKRQAKCDGFGQFDGRRKPCHPTVDRASADSFILLAVTLTSRCQGDALAVPPLVRDAFELLAREEEDALVQLATIRTLRGWLGQREQGTLAAARAQDYSWEQIGQAQGRPRAPAPGDAEAAAYPRS